jgi:hypothetical protein
MTVTQLAVLVSVVLVAVGLVVGVLAVVVDLRFLLDLHVRIPLVDVVDLLFLLDLHVLIPLLDVVDLLTTQPAAMIPWQPGWTR